MHTYNSDSCNQSICTYKDDPHSVHIECAGRLRSGHLLSQPERPQLATGFHCSIHQRRQRRDDAEWWIRVPRLAAFQPGRCRQTRCSPLSALMQFILDVRSQLVFALPLLHETTNWPHAGPVIGALECFEPSKQPSAASVTFVLVAQREYVWPCPPARQSRPSAQVLTSW